MPPPEARCDEYLLASVPVATRVERQKGYSIDLLEKGVIPAKRAATGHGPLGGYTPDNRSSLGTVLGKARKSPSVSEKSDPLPRRRTSWWRTASGIAVPLILIFIIVGSVVGGTIAESQGSRMTWLGAARHRPLRRYRSRTW
ncbi:hypothetical protein NEOLEDRAFT_941576 [Neolentinus lepideus HHB14362 ss-1]|uniref:Uncharacterized protein n=1 Tax=Neolentinus lepideus HHB14362 ss-1 TaxID=1314782 RepID=A0A165NFF3_9AGAM|nr:hypothetical protein NEOLEDRAFT_941576 [Neolentinus lepideus HHB14362 ss-1]